MPVFRAEDLRDFAAGLLTKLEHVYVLFIDEIHRLTPAVEESLYPAIESFQIDIMTGDGPYATTIQLALKPFTLIGATTRTGLLTAPLLSRFGYVVRLDYYPVEELQRIVERSARLLDVPIETAGAREIAARSRGTPRVANRLLRRVRDFAEVLGSAPSRRASPAPRPSASRSTRPASTRWIAGSSRSSSTTTTEARSASTPSPPR